MFRKYRSLRFLIIKSMINTINDYKSQRLIFQFFLITLIVPWSYNNYFFIIFSLFLSRGQWVKAYNGEKSRKWFKIKDKIMVWSRDIHGNGRELKNQLYLKTFKGAFKNKLIIQKISYLSCKLKLKAETKFLAIELFDK